MGEIEASAQPLVIPEDWHLHYDYTTGPIVGRFLTSLRDGRIEATRCPSCHMAWLPPRAYCERCFVPVDEWTEVGHEGVLQAATIVMQKVEGLPDPPFVIAYCQLGGADTSLLNFLETELGDIREAAARLTPGAPVRVRFDERREARITDFHYELA